MIVTNAADFLAAYASTSFPIIAPTNPRAVFMVTPSGFSLARESATDNQYMQLDAVANPERALSEHAQLATALRDCLPTIVFPGDPSTPDAVFPNNVFATARGRLIVGAMRHPLRRREAQRTDIRTFFTDMLNFSLIDLSMQAMTAELTGALVIDRGRQIGFCGLSERCDMAGARAMHDAFGLKLTFCFPLAATEYHTNVVLAPLASRALVIAPDGFAHRDDADAICSVYAPHVISIDASQKSRFAGNAIALDEKTAWLSAAGAGALRADQRDALRAAGFEIRSIVLAEIEKAGGSLRCCVGEIF